ncbi:hypothetical protein PCANB_001395 [Pneumocystis canis]|nr:hypothetical protein PCK1_001447 [Pneumocystis canis]KAG5439097.1 hypothetical protein PCANB_001395 [Pneumocystis canis]
MISVKPTFKSFIDFGISEYFLSKKNILWKSKKNLLIKKYWQTISRHLTVYRSICNQKWKENEEIQFQGKKEELSYNKSDLKTIESISSSEKIARQSPIPSNSFNPSNNIEISEKRYQKPYIYHRAASREVKNQDIISSWKSLDILLKQNNVRREERMGRFYEKPTKKRSRLRSERHRKRFKASIRHLVSIVKEMKRRGM